MVLARSMLLAIFALVLATSFCESADFSEPVIVASQFWFPNNELLAPDSLVNRVRDDLARIRNEFSILTRVVATDQPKLGFVQVQWTYDAFPTVVAGTHTGLNELLRQFPSPPEMGVFSPFRVTTFLFSLPYNPHVLLDMFIRLEGAHAVPKNISKTNFELTHVRLRPDLDYEFSAGWGDCPAGCLYYHRWIVRVTPQDVELVQESGDALAVKPTSWGRLKAVYIRNK